MVEDIVDQNVGGHAFLKLVRRAEIDDAISGKLRVLVALVPRRNTDCSTSATSAPRLHASREIVVETQMRAMRRNARKAVGRINRKSMPLASAKGVYAARAVSSREHRVHIVAPLASTEGPRPISRRFHALPLHILAALVKMARMTIIREVLARVNVVIVRSMKQARCPVQRAVAGRRSESAPEAALQVFATTYCGWDS